MLLILLGFALLVLEVKVTSHGLLAVGGIVSLLLRLDDADRLAAAGAADRAAGDPAGRRSASAGIILFLVRLGVRAQRQPAVTGESGMLHDPARR